MTPEGTIRTGASRRAVVPAYEPVLRAAVDAVAGRGALYVYGSVATGTAVVPTSDVDLLSVGLPADEAARISADLSATFRYLCREVSIGPATWDDLEGDTDATYGLRVFLRHYGVHLDGPDPAAELPDFPADTRAARGFNGDIGLHLARWRSALEDGEDVPRLATRIARTSLLAVAGLVSVRDATWTTDRRTSAERWNELEPATPVDDLVAWLETPPHDPVHVRGALDGPIAAIVEAFASEIGLWHDERGPAEDPAPGRTWSPGAPRVRPSGTRLGPDVAGSITVRSDPGERMRAIVYDRYGSPEVLRLDDVPMPSPGPGQVLIEVVATSVNLSDWECLRGSPAYARIGGLRAPKRRTLGSDVAGRVTAVGDEVSRLRPGDAVYGDNLDLMGGFAEYAVAPEAALAPKPEAMSFAEASTIPQAGAIALQGTAGVGPGQRMLINGGGGGSGAFAIQLAKQAGAHVTAIDNAGKLEFMRSLGADEVGDYREQDFGDFPPFDRILDLVATRSASACHRALAAGGRYQCVGGAVHTLLPLLALGAVMGRRSGRRVGMLAVKQGPAHFEPLAERCVAGEVSVHIDRTFGLDEVPAALTHVGEGRSLGKAVVEIRRDP